MKNQNTELLNELINDRLEVAYKLDSSDEDYNHQPLNEALKAIDKINDIEKNELDLEKIKLELENKLQIEKIKNESDHKKLELELEVKHKVEMEKINLERERIKLENETKNRVEMEKIKLEREKYILENITKNRVENEKIRIEGEKINLEREKNCDVINIENDKLVIDSLLKVLEIGVVLVAVPVVENRFKTKFAKMICEFEKDYNFTTTAGRSLSSLFKFKK